MFIHQGNRRTARHNLRIASLLSFVAGMVNVAGFLAIAKLTTNVTGHFAYLIDEVFKMNFSQGLVYFLYIFFFFLGSFVSSFLIEITFRWNPKRIYMIPTVLEAVMLSGVAAFSGSLIESPDILACFLLFAMGLQNSLVTRISDATVRTTHLTGLFTDLGIEIAQMLFIRDDKVSTALRSSVRLRLTIIISFFTGGLISGVFYSYVALKVLFLGVALLAIAMIFDNLKTKLRLLKIKVTRRRYRNNRNNW